MTEQVLWLGADLLAGLEGELISGNLQNISGISIDSRDITQGDAFFAIKGDKFDGHAYTQMAADQGSKAVIISDQKSIPKAENVAVILVNDVLVSLGKLAIAARARSKAKIIAITGSVGKTSSKEFLLSCLQKVGKCHASVKSFNNHWGVPVSLARMPADCDYAIFEIGMNHLNEITPLVKMVRPNIAIITTVAPAHLGFFKDLEEIALAKSEIFEGISQHGYAILNHDNQFFDYLKNKAQAKDVENIQSFGVHKDSDLRLINVDLKPDHSMVEIELNGQKHHYKIGSPGRHQVQNSLGLLLIVANLAIDINDILPVLANISLSDGRGSITSQAIASGVITLIDESYNANPASMVAAFSVLDAQYPKKLGIKIAILGDMLELGTGSPQIHANLATEIMVSKIDKVMACGTDMKYCYDLLPVDKQMLFAKNSFLLAESILDHIHPDDVVMVKGSLGSKMSKIVNKIKLNFEGSQ